MFLGMALRLLKQKMRQRSEMNLKEWQGHVPPPHEPLRSLWMLLALESMYRGTDLELAAVSTKLNGRAPIVDLLGLFIGMTMQGEDEMNDL